MESISLYFPLIEIVSPRIIISRWLHISFNVTSPTPNVPLNVGGLRAILTDQNKMVVAVGGITALAAGVYTTRYYIYECQVANLRILCSILLYTFALKKLLLPK